MVYINKQQINSSFLLSKGGGTLFSLDVVISAFLASNFVDIEVEVYDNMSDMNIICTGDIHIIRKRTTFLEYSCHLYKSIFIVFFTYSQGKEPRAERERETTCFDSSC